MRTSSVSQSVLLNSLDELAAILRNNPTELTQYLKPIHNMDTGIVKSVADTGQKWNDMTKVKVNLEDGRYGIVNAKNFPPPYGVGDTVEIKATWPDGNLKSIAKVSEGFTPQTQSKADTGHSGASQGPSGDTRSHDIQVAQSVNLAVDTLTHTVWAEGGLDNEKYIAQVKYMAKEYYQALKELKEEIQ